MRKEKVAFNHLYTDFARGMFGYVLFLPFGNFENFPVH
jgi:hypothetical protein